MLACEAGLDRSHDATVRPRVNSMSSASDHEVASSGPQRYSIGEVSRITGVGVHALRWFEREGLFPMKVERTPGGQRVFDADIVYWITLCTTLRRTGMPIARVQELASLIEAGPGNEADRMALLEAHEATVRARIRDLEESLAVISAKTAIYRSNLEAGTAGGLWDPTTPRDPQDPPG
ncbi:MerR family transcriptional regulator [Microbacterium sp. NPDC056052]|uniref:MerR family transcriptional regulator n=1 Tax=Microbacterium sp. NPDC056052 TaxID=3345695 RepID=UPI0035D6489A